VQAFWQSSKAFLLQVGRKHLGHSEAAEQVELVAMSLKCEVVESDLLIERGVESCKHAARAGLVSANGSEARHQKLRIQRSSSARPRTPIQQATAQ